MRAMRTTGIIPICISRCTVKSNLSIIKVMSNTCIKYLGAGKVFKLPSDSLITFPNIKSKMKITMIKILKPK